MLLHLNPTNGILVLGSNGQLGKCLYDHYSNENVLFLEKKDLDILDKGKLAKIIKLLP